ncbi:hypothetical protein [Eikenella sp. NML080894]
MDADFVEHLLAFAFAYGRTVTHSEAASGLNAGFHSAGLHIGNVAVVAGGGKLNQEEEGDQQNEQAADKGDGGLAFDVVSSGVHGMGFMVCGRYGRMRSMLVYWCETFT